MSPSRLALRQVKGGSFCWVYWRTSDHEVRGTHWTTPEFKIGDRDFFTPVRALQFTAIPEHHSRPLFLLSHEQAPAAMRQRKPQSEIRNEFFSQNSGVHYKSWNCYMIKNDKKIRKKKFLNLSSTLNFFQLPWDYFFPTLTPAPLVKGALICDVFSLNLFLSYFIPTLDWLVRTQNTSVLDVSFQTELSTKPTAWHFCHLQNCRSDFQRRKGMSTELATQQPLKLSHWSAEVFSSYSEDDLHAGSTWLLEVLLFQ